MPINQRLALERLSATFRAGQFLACLLALPVLGAEFGTETRYSDQTTGFEASSDVYPQIEEFLPAAEAFQAALEFDRSDAQLAINWQIAPDYYLYEHSIKVSLVDSQGLATDITPMLSSSPSLRRTDPHIGQIKVFFNSAKYQLPAKNTQLDVKRSDIAGIRVEYEGCASNGLCYETQTVDFVTR